MSVTTDVFRKVFRKCPSGVAVFTSRVWTARDDVLRGIVIGSYCSLSADQPRVMFSASRSAQGHGVVESGTFAVSNFARRKDASSSGSPALTRRTANGRGVPELGLRQLSPQDSESYGFSRSTGLRLEFVEIVERVFQWHATDAAESRLQREFPQLPFW